MWMLVFSRKIIILSLIIIFFCGYTKALADNTYSAGFASASTQYAHRTTDLGITNGAITMEFWYKPASTPGVSQALVYKGDTGVHVSYMVWYSADPGSPTIRGFRSRDGVGSTISDYTVTLDTSTWYHIAYTYDGTTQRLYTATAGGTHTLRDFDAASGNGSGFTGDETSIAIDYQDGIPLHPANGEIDDVRFWNDARTVTELDDNFETELVGNEANLVAYYKLNNDWTDETSNSYDLTAVNTPTFSTDVPFTGAVAAAIPEDEYIIFFE